MARNERISEFLKDCLADALIAKMREKPFEKITVDEIATAAGVGRATYFRHFSSKREMLTYKIVRNWQTQAERRKLKEPSKFDINNAVDFFEINYSIKDVLDTVYAANMQSALLDAFGIIMLPDCDDEPFAQYRDHFYSYGLFGLLNAWIKNGYKQTPREMADTIIKITSL